MNTHFSDGADFALAAEWYMLAAPGYLGNLICFFVCEQSEQFARGEEKCCRRQKIVGAFY